MSQVGRISGPLLKSNLERNGIDLAFRDNLSTTQLLYLDVNNGKIAVNTDSPSKDLDIAGNSKTNTVMSTTASLANFVIENNTIDTLSGNVFLSASNSIILSGLGTNNLRIDDNIISNYNSNSNIVLQPNGSGTTEVYANLNINGNLHSSGNITANGNITFGNTNTDDITFNADVNSNLVPSQNNNYNIGSSDKKWQALYTNLVNGQTVSVGDLSVGLLDFNLKYGNIFYVAENGDDSNSGDHIQGPFKTIKRALDAADASTGGPVVVFVFAGGYEEDLPLVVPSNVSVIGEDMRNTFVRPSSADQSKDIFQLNGETTVQNLTVTDFYYDSINDTGYAFSFAPNTIVSNRSPYIQNCSVITKGTTTSVDDPRGFASGDAGKGALIDGASVNNTSQEASMLFHSCTFITPGVDAITMTNGVRVEWLNSFTYFADKGLYAVDGTTGHLSTDGSTIKYGAEIRSIGSASVYGNYGAVADGDDCLMYLIQHNFSYIGSGRYTDNDPSRSIQNQEVNEINNGRIFYQSIDHLGNFRVGNEFFVDQDLGETTLNLSEGDIDSITGLNITTNGNTTFIDGTKIDIGNFTLSGNTIKTNQGDLNVSSQSSKTNFLTNTFMKKNLSISESLSIGGSVITLGNEFTDTIEFDTDLNQSLEVGVSSNNNLGTISKRWAKAWLSSAEIGDVKFFDTNITTTKSNSNLEFRANGTGKILFEGTNLDVINNFSVIGNSNLLDLTLTGNVSHTGDRFQTGNHNLINFNIIGNFDTASQIQLEKIHITGNTIETVDTNSDLELYANGTGNIFIPYNDVSISKNISIRDFFGNNVNAPNNEFLFDNPISTDGIEIYDNVITTINSNEDLELRANSAGSIYLDRVGFKNSSIFSDIENLIFQPAQNINIDSNGSMQIPTGTTLQRVISSGSFLDGGQALNSGSILDGGNAFTNFTSNNTIYNAGGAVIAITGELGDIRFNVDNNLFEGTGSDVIMFGGVYSSDTRTSVLADKTANQIDFKIDNVSVGSVNSGGLEIHSLDVDDIFFNNNTISTDTSNSNLELVTNGIGEIVIDDVSFINNFIKNNSSEYDGSSSAGILSINSTGFGKVKFDNTYGIVIPSGGDSERPTNPPTGDTRWNTDSMVLETWDGNQYIVAAGVAEAISAQEFDELLLELTLTLG